MLRGRGSKNARGRLDALFPNLEVPHATLEATTSKSSAPKGNNLSASVRKAIFTGWPTWRTIRGRKAHPPELTIRLRHELEAEAIKMDLPVHPAKIIAKARHASPGSSAAGLPDLWPELENALVSLVYGSNRIESAGAPERVTIRLCRQVFRGLPASTDIDTDDPDYGAHVALLEQTGRRSDRSAVIRSRVEVVQHAKALNFLVEEVVLSGKDLTEELVRQTHAILCEGLDDEDVVPGEYRTHEVAVRYGKPGKKVRTNQCIRAAAVPRYMEQMFEHLRKDMTTAEEDGEIDPYTLAARYHHQFVMIHPFGDGNGRLSRMILNVLLLRYAGHLSLFGSTNEEKDDYLDCVRRGSKDFHGEDMEVEFESQTSHQATAKFILAKSQRGLKELWGWATGGMGGDPEVPADV